MIRRLSLLCLFALALNSFAGKQDSAPSSHMVGNDRFDGDIIINEVRIPKAGEARYTYYEALGWRGLGGGYAGIQAHPRGHNFIFSIWDNKAHTAQIKAIHHGPGTKTEPFGGEGTGLKSWNFELGWKTDEWQTLVARNWPLGDQTQYGFWARSEGTKQWTHLVTMEVAASKAYFRGGNDSFLEDWLNTGKTKRTTHLRGGWKRKLDGTWFPVTGIRYSVNAGDLRPGKRSYNFRTNWDGGVSKDPNDPYFYMTSGGADTTATTKNPSHFTIPRTATRPSYPTIRIENLTAKIENGQLKATWKNDARTLPQFSYQLEVFTNSSGNGKPLIATTATIPHGRSHTLDSSTLDFKNKIYFLRLRCTDILDGTSNAKVIPLGKPRG